MQIAQCGVAAEYAGVLLDSLQAEFSRVGGAIGLTPEQAWRDSGLAVISGFPDAAGRSCPAPLASCADGVMLALNALVAQHLPWVGRRLLGMRRLSHALKPGGRISANGSCRLLATANGDIAVNLARHEDWELLPAWLECETVESWDALSWQLMVRERDELVERARWLGMAVAPSEPVQPRDWAQVEHLTPQPHRSRARFKVIDLSALWAGPLCSFLLASCGAEVVRVENPHRPDGARLGPTNFFNALNASKTTRELDLATPAGRDALLAMIAEADVVIEGSRPRALRHLGIDAKALVAQHPGLCWLSITGYGRDEPQGEWVAFGDDAAVAAGLSELMRTHYGQAMFCGDAIADPLTGMHAALLVMAARHGGYGGLFSLALRDVTAHALCTGLKLL